MCSLIIHKVYTMSCFRFDLISYDSQIFMFQCWVYLGIFLKDDVYQLCRIAFYFYWITPWGIMSSWFCKPRLDRTVLFLPDHRVSHLKGLLNLRMDIKVWHLPTRHFGLAFNPVFSPISDIFLIWMSLCFFIWIRLYPRLNEPESPEVGPGHVCF